LSNEFLNFAEISKAIPFSDVLNWLNLTYTEKNDELRGEGYIISKEKNMFFVPDNDDLKGSVINFVAHYKEVDLREAASILKKHFLSKTKEKKPKRDIPNLTLDWHDYLGERGIKPEIAEKYQAGLVKERSIVTGRIAFKIHDSKGKHIGYIGYKVEDGSWFFPKGFKRPLYNANDLNEKLCVIVTVEPFDTLRLASLGFKQVASLLANSMTAEQEEQLKQFKYILLLHKEPGNIIQRLYNSSYVKAPVLSKPLKDMTEQELYALINPPKPQN
jgi:hypothetical protein